MEESPKEKEAFSIIRRAKSFAHAGRGIKVYLMSTHNAWIHLMACILVIILGLYFSITHTEWLILILTMGIVLAAEAFNTAIEFDINLTSPEYHPYARDTKDIAAGAVLITALMAIAIGLVIFLPRIILG